MSIPPGNLKRLLRATLALGAAMAAVAASTGCSTSPDAAEHALEKQLISSRLDAAARLCIEADIAALPCRDEQPTPEFTPESGVSQFGAKLVDGFRQSRPRNTLEGIAVASMMGGISPGTIVTTANLRELLLESHARKEVASITSRFERKIAGDRLDRCHAVCLIQCFTSGAMVYDHDTADADDWGTSLMGSRSDEGPYVAAAEGKGMCRNYASLAKEVGSLIGEDIDSVLTDSGAHRVAGYADSGRAYLIEPQENPIEEGACKRYPVP